MITIHFFHKSEFQLMWNCWVTKIISLVTALYVIRTWVIMQSHSEPTLIPFEQDFTYYWFRRIFSPLLMILYVRRSDLLVNLRIYRLNIIKFLDLSERVWFKDITHLLSFLDFGLFNADVSIFYKQLYSFNNELYHWSQLYTQLERSTHHWKILFLNAVT